jgi:hypothetical protein
MTTSASGKRFPCPCCGYLVFDQGPGSYDICPICFWEDDAVQLEFATNGGGANKASLVEAQQNFATFGACERAVVRHVRAPSEDDERELNWRPIDLERDKFDVWGNRAAERAPQLDETLYYWRANFWRHASR